MGSSPRVRGKDAAFCEAADVEGIIPAGAGKRKNEKTPTGGPWDHPRGCGEKKKA